MTGCAAVGIHRRGALLGLAGLGTGLVGGTAWAQSGSEYPNRPIRVIVPSPPGGPPDLILRAISPKMTAVLGQPLVLENRAGGGGLVGTAYVARQPADGYAWLFTTASHTNIPPFNDNVTYDPVRDFAHVTLAAQNFGQVLVVHPAVPAHSVAELVALARREPGRLTYANAGNGTASHIPAELMKATTGTESSPSPTGGWRKARRPARRARGPVLRGHADRAAARAGRPPAGVGADRPPPLERHARRTHHGGSRLAGLRGGELVRPLDAGRRAGPDRLPGHAAVAAAVREPEVQQQFETLGLEGVAMLPEPFAHFVREQARVAQEIGRRVGAAAR